MNSVSKSLWPLLPGISLLFTTFGLLHAAPSAQQWQSLNHSLVEEHILPRYRMLQNSSARIAASTQALCPQTELRQP